MATTVTAIRRVAIHALPHKGRERIIPELDGLRGLAILLVLLVHLQPTAAVPSYLQRIFSLGWSGVDLFFVLSGFLITGILLRSRHAANYFSSFYARRILRIFPLYLIVVAALFHVVLPLAHHWGYLPNDNNSLEPWFWVHLSNWKIAFGHDMLFIGHFWSLAIEEQFYLFWPLIVFLAGRKGLPYVCVGVIAASSGLRMVFSQSQFPHEFLYVLTPFRLEPLAFGALAACAAGSDWLRTTGAKLLPWIAAAGILILTTVLLTGKTGEPYFPPMATFGFTGFALLYTSFVLYASLYSGSRRPLASCLRVPVLRFFGKYSYGIYVFHWPIFVLLASTVARLSLRLGPALRLEFWIVAGLAEVALTCGVALLSWNLLEKHFLKLKRRFAAA